MTDLCDGCIESARICHIKKQGADPKDCPCLNCLVKSMCRSGCNDYYGLKYGTKLKGKK